MSTVDRTLDPRTPVIIGVGQFLNRPTADGAPEAGELEPTDLMVEALRAAETDSGATGVLPQVGVVAVVPVVSWRYRDPGRLVAASVGCDDASTWTLTLGGNSPQSLLNRLCTDVQAGRADLGVVVGGEAYRTRMAARKAERTLPWSRQAEDLAPTWSDGDTFEFGHPAELARGIVMPTQSYPLFENALRHDSGASAEDHLTRVGRMWADYSRVAAHNPFAWRHESFTAAEVTTPTAGNRLIGYPYTKRMVSNPDVDMASAVIIASVAKARALGVAEDRWVFPHAGTDAVDPVMSERPDFVSSASIGVAGNLALELAGVSIDDVDHLDVYSCFPSAVQIACRELGIDAFDPQRPLTVYGGLCFAGGPWNNPVGHAIASMVGVLRHDPGSFGFVTANGGIIEKHAFGVYSTEPPATEFRWERPQDTVDAAGRVSVTTDHDGPATVEAWTVMHDRDGSASRAHAACRTPEGMRTWGVTDDPGLMAAFEAGDPIGDKVQIGSEGRLDVR
jgi:acetyl-CoA C-acetyltransferase